MYLEEILDKIKYGLQIAVTVGFIGGCGAACISNSGILGNRGTNQVAQYSFQGKPLMVMQKDWRFRSDEYFATNDGVHIIEGQFVLDDGRTLHVNDRIYELFKYGDDGSFTTYKVK